MEAAEAVNKLEAILRESPLPELAADSGSKPADSGISFENVTFSYDGADRPALTNVSFHSRCRKNSTRKTGLSGN